MNYKITREKLFLAAGLVLIALCVCMTSPLNPLSGGVPQTDSSAFLTIAQGILRGKLPYVDFFDHKGPLIYFINAIGLSMGGLIGVWLLEWFFMFVSVCFAYKTARFFSGKMVSFLAAGFSFIVLSRFLQGGNLTEEYALPFIFISLYIFTRYCFTQIEPDKVQLTILGVSFGAILLLRPNMFGVWFSFCIVIFIRKLLLKEYKTLFGYFLFFIIGISIVILPAILFLYTKNAYNDFIYQYIIFNSSFFVRSPAQLLTLSFMFNIDAVINLNCVCLSLIVAIIWLTKRLRNKEYIFYIAYLISLLTSVFLIVLSGDRHEHYYLPLVPLFVPVFSFCIDKLFLIFSTSRYNIIKYGIPVMILLIFVNHDISHAGYRILINGLTSKAEEEYRQAGTIIDLITDEEDTISVLGNSCTVYLYTKRNSASKYIYQLPIAEYSIKAKNEYLSDILTQKPKALIISSAFYDWVMSSGIFTSILSMIDNEYAEIFKSNNLAIYSRYTSN